MCTCLSLLAARLGHRFLQLNRGSHRFLDFFHQASFASRLAPAEPAPAAQDPPYSLCLGDSFLIAILSSVGVCISVDSHSYFVGAVAQLLTAYQPSQSDIPEIHILGSIVLGISIRSASSETESQIFKTAERKVNTAGGQQ